MPGHKFSRLRQEIVSLRHEKAITEKGEIVPRSVLFLEEELSSEQDAISRFDIYLLLRDECLRAGLPRQEIEYARRCTRDMPREPLSWIALANLISENVEGRQEAIEIALEAVRVARKADRFVRHSLCSLARAYSRNSDYRGLESVLRDLIDEAAMMRSEDGPYDTDFISDLPPGAIDGLLIEKYKSLATTSEKS
jgi:hypothetical protein